MFSVNTAAAILAIILRRCCDRYKRYRAPIIIQPSNSLISFSPTYAALLTIFVYVIREIRRRNFSGVAYHLVELHRRVSRVSCIRNVDQRNQHVQIEQMSRLNEACCSRRKYPKRAMQLLNDTFRRCCSTIARKRTFGSPRTCSIVELTSTNVLDCQDNSRPNATATRQRKRRNFKWNVTNVPITRQTRSGKIYYVEDNLIRKKRLYSNARPTFNKNLSQLDT